MSWLLIIVSRSDPPSPPLRPAAHSDPLSVLPDKGGFSGYASPIACFISINIDRFVFFSFSGFSSRSSPRRVLYQSSILRSFFSPPYPPLICRFFFSDCSPLPTTPLPLAPRALAFPASALSAVSFLLEAYQLTRCQFLNAPHLASIF